MQLKNMEIKYLDNQSQRLFLFHTDGEEQFPKRIKSAEEECNCQKSNMVNQRYKFDSMEVLDNIPLSNTRKIWKSHCPWLWSNTINLKFEKKKDAQKYDIIFLLLALGYVGLSLIFKVCKSGNFILIYFINEEKLSVFKQFWDFEPFSLTNVVTQLFAVN